ncbi:MAG TPA: hypothetical protein VKB06_00135, partial [Nitrososphaera sp.]|nr:hypothetical protein [Nitrososphaera sp.]
MSKYNLGVIFYVPKASSVLAIAVAVATLIPVSIGLSGLGQEVKIGGRQTVGIYNNADSSIEDAQGDVTPVYQQVGIEEVPETRDYHDILRASVQKRGDAFFFTVVLAGNPNDNNKYETQYRWHIITTSPITNREQQYIIRFQNSAFDGNNSTMQGWYFAVFDRTVGKFIVPPTSIPDMTDNTVEFPIEDFYIGNPSSFSYWVDVSVRVNATFGQPD